MKKLFDNIIQGLVAQGYRRVGGGEMFEILEKDGKTVKVFLAYGGNYFIIRYS